MRDSATLISKMVSEEIDVFWNSAQSELNQINLALNTIHGNNAKKKYLRYVLENSPEYKNIISFKL